MYFCKKNTAMKIRCEQNSIRLRLRRSELVQLRAEKWLGAAVHFPNGPDLGWELLLEDGLPDMTATFLQNRVIVKAPYTRALYWMDTDEVGMECFLPLGAGTALHVLVEKDFPCKDRPDEDKTYFFTELSEEAPVKC